MNDDRISEVYKGEIWSDEAQARARRRIDWLCRNVAGDRVLDIGTSQGIVPILLGREGFTVVGVDVQPDRIEYAKADLDKESEVVRDRVTFIVGEGSSLDFPDESFDSIVMGEIIEHLAAPERVLEEAVRLLRPDGRLVLTTPFGVLHHHDHRQTFYPDGLLELVGGLIGVTDAEVDDRYFRLVCAKGSETAPGIREDLLSSAFIAVQGIQEDLATTRTQRLRLEREVSSLTKTVSTLETQVASGKEELTAQQHRADAAAQEMEKAQPRIAKLKQEVEDLSAQLRRVEQELDEAGTQLQLVEQSRAKQQADLEAARRRARQLAERQDLVQHRLAVARWKLAANRQRRWWRLGALLGQLRRNPSRLPSVLAEVARVLRTPQPKLPRPTPPESVRDAAQASTPVVEVTEPLLPRRDVVAVGVVGAGTRALLDHEFLFWRLSEREWAEQLETLRPQVLVLEDSETATWDEDVVESLRTAAEALGAQIVPLERDEAVASVHPRLHNPGGGQSRSEDHAVVDPTRRTVGETAFDEERSFLEAVKRHRVVVVSADREQAELARVAATSTPMIVTASEDYRGFGTPVTGDESMQSAIDALVRSEPFAARQAHIDMRRALRGHDFGSLFRGLGADGARTPTVDVMVATMRPHRLENLLDNLGRQTFPSARLFLIGHGIDLDEVKVRDLAEERGVHVAGVWTEAEELVAGDVFNRGFARTESGLIAKMDDDDFYGAEYLWDLVTAKDASRAEVAGKWAHYAYLEGPDATVYRFRNQEHRFKEVVAISTLLMDREVLDDEQFPHMPYGSGSVFLRAIGAAGARVFAADRWNYVYFRGADGQRNTFPVSDLKMLAKSDVVCRGLALDEVTV